MHSTRPCLFLSGDDNMLYRSQLSLHISLTQLEGHVGQKVPITVQFEFKCVPAQSAFEAYNARQQLWQVDQIIGGKLRKDVQDAHIQDERHCAELIRDAIHEERNALAEFIEIQQLKVVVSRSDLEEAVDRPTTETDPQPYVNGDELCQFSEADIAAAERIEADVRGLTRKASVSLNLSSAESTATTKNDRPEGLVNQSLPSKSLEQLMRDLDAQLALHFSKAFGPMFASPPELPRPMKRGVVVALGSNVGNRVEEIEKACRAIDEDPDMRIVDTSLLYETEPMYVEDQDRFVNGACEVGQNLRIRIWERLTDLFQIATSLSPIDLLDRLQAIEKGHGRVKFVDKGPRNIDLDISIFRRQVVDTERLKIPHALMKEREFVLRPIQE